MGTYVLAVNAMRLNAEIVSRELARTYQLRSEGPAERELLLHRPELLEADARELLDNHLYVCRVEQLPQRTAIGENVAIVTIGSSPRLRVFRERCHVISIEGKGDLFEVFNQIQRLFQRYSHWKETLLTILTDDASIPAMLDASTQVLEGSLDVLDANLHLLGWTTSKEAERLAREGGYPLLPIADESGNLNPDSMSEFLAQHDLAMDVGTPFVMTVSGLSVLNANLLEHGTYLGCLSVMAPPGSSCDMADAPVVALLAEFVKRAMRRLDVSADKTKGSLRRSLSALVDGEKLDALSSSTLAAEGGSWVCLKMRLNKRGARLPLAYVRNLVEDNVPDTVAFIHQRSYVVAFVRLDGLAPEGERRHELERLLEPLTGSIGMRVGISDHLRGLESARTHYLQAGIALENGMAVSPEATIYRFQDYALPELIMNSLGELPAEAYYTPGLRKLFAHDEHSPVSYVDTLECYLSLNMSVSATARALYLHRSTLVERLGHIRDAMGSELDDSLTRLRIRIVLEATRFDRELRSRK